MGTKNKVSSIKEKLHKLEKQLETIQKSCTHKKLSLKFINLNNGVRWVCDECQIFARIPSPEEIKEWTSK
jgi:hypothetical protein|tara:strand:+ start:1115 stop:1324 length:210 start_codon:yes stop_codon:yes gene_type:complete